MAMKCISGAGECTGCMACQDYDEDILRCDDCGREICNGDNYYEIASHIICLDCIDEYWRVKQ